jgi:hypothetical protein
MPYRVRFDKDLFLNFHRRPQNKRSILYNSLKHSNFGF